MNFTFMMQLLQIDRVEDEMIWTVIYMRWVGCSLSSSQDVKSFSHLPFSGLKRMFLPDSGCVLLLVIGFYANWERERVLKADISSVNFEFMLLALPLLTDNELLFIPKCQVWNFLYTAYLLRSSQRWVIV